MKSISCCGKRDREGQKKSRTDMVIWFLETAVEIIDMVVVCGIVDVELKRVDADDGSCVDFNLPSFSKSCSSYIIPYCWCRISICWANRPPSISS